MTKSKTTNTDTKKPVTVELWGSRLKEVRLALGLTQTALAKEIEISGQRVGSIEKLDVTSIQKKSFDNLIEKFNVNPAYLQGYEYDKEKMFSKPIEDKPEEDKGDLVIVEDVETAKEENTEDLPANDPENEENSDCSDDKDPYHRINPQELREAINVLSESLRKIKMNSLSTSEETQTDDQDSLPDVEQIREAFRKLGLYPAVPEGIPSLFSSRPLLSYPTYTKNMSPLYKKDKNLKKVLAECGKMDDDQLEALIAFAKYLNSTSDSPKAVKGLIKALKSFKTIKIVI